MRCIAGLRARLRGGVRGESTRAGGFARGVSTSEGCFARGLVVLFDWVTPLETTQPSTYSQRLSISYHHQPPPAQLLCRVEPSPLDPGTAALCGALHCRVEEERRGRREEQLVIGFIRIVRRACYPSRPTCHHRTHPYTSMLSSSIYPYHSASQSV